MVCEEMVKEIIMNKGKRKYICTMIMVLFVFAMTACGKKNGADLYEKGLELTEVLVEAVESDDYWESMGFGSDEFLDYVEDMREGKYTEPKKVYVLTVSDKGVENLLEELDLEDASERLQQTIIYKMFGSITTRFNAQMGSTPLAVSSVYNVSTSFVCDDAQESCVYIYEYKKGLPVVVTFAVGEDNAVTATAGFLMSVDLLDDLKETLDDTEFYDELGIEIEELDID